MHESDAGQTRTRWSDLRPKWPARFTDNWFATHVAGMDDGMLRALRAELYRRSWSDDEIADRVLVHAHESAHAGPPESLTVAGSPRTDPDGRAEDQGASFPSRFTVDENDPVGRATLKAAEDLASAGAEGVRVRERHLADALARHLGAVAERRLHVPGWEPQPGNVDAFTSDWRGRPVLVVETKLKEGNEVFECLWDMAKVLSLATESSVEDAYLVTGTTVASWQRPVACAELFTTGRHELVGAIRRYEDWWIRYILGDSRGRPSSVPDLMDVDVVAAVQYPMNSIPWELRSIRVSVPSEATWIPFRNGLPDR